jgi:hypothetical protein
MISSRSSEMPSVSKKQHGFMGKVAGSPAFAKKAGVPQSVGQEFMQADAGAGGMGAGMGGMKRGGKTHPKKMAKGGVAEEHKEMAFMKKHHAPKSMIKHEEAEMKEGMKHGGKVHHKKMAAGGKAMDEESRTHSELKMKHGGKLHHKKMAAGGKALDEEQRVHEEMKMKRGGHVKKMAAGGKVGVVNGPGPKEPNGLAAGHKTADRLAQRGHTRGINVTMCKGGRAK